MNETIEKIKVEFDKAFGCHNDRAEAVGMHSNYSYQAFLNFTLEALALLEKPVDLVKQTIVSTENKPAETGSGFVKKARDYLDICNQDEETDDLREYVRKACDLLDEKDREYEILEGVIKRQRKGGMELTNLYKSLQSEIAKLKKALEIAWVQYENDEFCAMVKTFEQALKKENNNGR